MDKLRIMWRELGMFITLAILSRDLLLLQNQIPRYVVETLMNSRYGAGKFDDLLNRYLCVAIYGEYREKRLCSKPVHIVEAIHMLIVLEPEKTSHGCCKCTMLCCFKVKQEFNNAPNASAAQNNRRAKKDNIKKFVHSFRSVTELKAKGIRFKPNSTQSLMDVSFESVFFYGLLQLPEWGVSNKTRVTFMNLIGYQLASVSAALAALGISAGQLYFAVYPNS
ncbi:UPF0481 protein [Salvia divinorum]|uniref:UPF0481 protein n=1 Tax=Salvia divinorum TaxID=28513 RepID=A0ABD1FLT3_SALDI